MKLLVYLIICTLGFAQLPGDYLNELTTYTLDEQTAVVQNIAQPQKTSDLNGFAKDNPNIVLDLENPYWDKVTLKGNVKAEYQIKQGNKALVIELPIDFLEYNPDTKILLTETSAIDILEIKQINDNLYFYLEHPVNHPIRVYTDNMNFKTIHIDIAKKVNPYHAVVVLDPGHGGFDPGATRYGMYEKDIVLDIAKKAEHKLKDNGINVIFTRKTDKYVELYARPAISNTIKPNAFVSIHINSSKYVTPKGISTHIYGLNEKQMNERDKLAKCVQNSLIQEFPTSSNLGILTNNFCVLRENKYPCALIEFGFISNPAERANLAKPEIREKAAIAITRGINNYINQ